MPVGTEGERPARCAYRIRNPGTPGVSCTRAARSRHRAPRRARQDRPDGIDAAAV